MISRHWWLCERRTMSSAKYRSSRRFVRVHCMSSRCFSVFVRISDSMTLQVHFVIYFSQLPQHFHINALIVHKGRINRRLPLKKLFQDDSQGINLICTLPILPEPSVFISQSFVQFYFQSLQNYLIQYFSDS